MLKKPPVGLFITGTDTGVGKTYVAALIAKALVAVGRRVGVYKPVASGCRRDGDELISDDAVVLWNAAGKPAALSDVCPQGFVAPLAPHLAARAEGKRVDAQLLRRGIEYWHGRCDIVLIEGAGGLMSPLSDEDYAADLAYEFGYPLIVVAPNVLGVINQTLQTLITAATFREGIDVAGVVLNDVPGRVEDDPSVQSNLSELERRCVPSVFAHVTFQAASIEPAVDWMKVANAAGSEQEDERRGRN